MLCCAKWLQLCQTLCNPRDCSLLGSSIHGILQARILEYLPCPSPGDLPDPGIEPGSPSLHADSLLLSHQGSPLVIYIIYEREGCSVVSDSLRPHGLYSPWDSPGDLPNQGIKLGSPALLADSLPTEL